VREWQIPEYGAAVLTGEKAMADYFEQAAGTGANAKTIANWIMTDLIRELGERQLTIDESPIPPAALAELVNLIEDKTISGKIAKTVFADMMSTGATPKAIVEQKGLVQVTDTDAIDAFVQQAIDENPAVVEEYRGGKGKALQYLVGQVMKFSRGKANPRMVVGALKAKLDQ